MADHAVADDDELLAEVRCIMRADSFWGRRRDRSPPAAGGRSVRSHRSRWSRGWSRGPRRARSTPGCAPAVTPAQAQISASSASCDGRPAGRSASSRSPGSCGPRTVPPVVVLGDQADPGEVADEGRRRRSRRRGPRACGASRRTGLDTSTTSPAVPRARGRRGRRRRDRWRAAGPRCAAAVVRRGVSPVRTPARTPACSQAGGTKPVIRPAVLRAVADGVDAADR